MFLLHSTCVFLLLCHFHLAFLFLHHSNAPVALCHYNSILSPFLHHFRRQHSCSSILSLRTPPHSPYWENVPIFATTSFCFHFSFVSTTVRVRSFLYWFFFSFGFVNVFLKHLFCVQGTTF